MAKRAPCTDWAAKRQKSSRRQSSRQNDQKKNPVLFRTTKSTTYLYHCDRAFSLIDGKKKICPAMTKNRRPSVGTVNERAAFLCTNPRRAVFFCRLRVSKSKKKERNSPTANNTDGAF